MLSSDDFPSLRRVSWLKEGEVVETEVEVGQSLRIMVNDSVIATGEVVVTDTGYGLRLDRIISPAERRIP
jgi:flagellar motor switch protein FliN/FliY